MTNLSAKLDSVLSIDEIEKTGMYFMVKSDE